MIMIDRQLQMQNACFHHVKMIVLIKKHHQYKRNRRFKNIFSSSQFFTLLE